MSSDARSGLAEIQQLKSQGNPSKVAKRFESLAKSHPNDPLVWHQWAIFAFEQGRLGEAEQRFRKAIALAPNDAHLYNNLGVLFEQSGRFPDACESFGRAVSLAPKAAKFHFNLGNALRAVGRVAEAETAYRQSAALEPRDAAIWHNIGVLLKENQRREEAEKVFRKSLELDPELIDAHINLGSTLQALGKYDEAMECYRKAQEIDPEYPDAIAAEAGLMEHQGQLDAAADKLLPLLDRFPENVDIALAFAGLARVLKKREEAASRLEKIIALPQLSPLKRSSVLFSLGKLHDALKNYDRAFGYYDDANRSCGKQFDIQRYRRFVLRTKQTFTKDLLARLPRTTNDSQIPVFVVGMPRSGTSLVEQIIASHPLAYGAGELGELDAIAQAMPAALKCAREYPECIEEVNWEVLDASAARYLRHIRGISPTAERIVDKMPGNFMHVGLIALLFPKARVIHIQRRAVDNCLSCFFQHFNNGHEYSYDLSALGFVYRQYKIITDYWHSLAPLPLLHVKYEDIVEDQEGQTRRMLEFCGLPWDERCLRFYETDRLVRTASYDQVRQPLYKTSAGRADRYGERLNPLREALGDLAAT